MGFNYLHCQKAAINTSNAGVEEAMNWLLSHMDDPDIDAPISQETQSAGVVSSFVDQSKVDTLVSFGFEEDIARKALKASGGDIEKATDWIFNPIASGPSDMDVSSSSTTIVDSALSDGGGSQFLVLFYYVFVHKHECFCCYYCYYYKKYYLCCLSDCYCVPSYYLSGTLEQYISWTIVIFMFNVEVLPPKRINKGSIYEL
ncbi:ubiquitin carboxyl-terminal hydrolase 14-like [Camellia sinensis]|uniref:ubiquitin carboxyl-terminal hydrolase 14-like n=1 Tax=Camellia sinensis TaxID=4442 RepID=UPI00103613EF|nr:ubiquitin carboxyl-terminal hydrolase 14-like [Camellia sinensis]